MRLDNFWPLRNRKVEIWKAMVKFRTKEHECASSDSSPGSEHASDLLVATPAGLDRAPPLAEAELLQIDEQREAALDLRRGSRRKRKP